MANDVVRCVLFESAAWKQWGRRGQRQATGKQEIVFPASAGDGGSASDGGPGLAGEDQQQDWEVNVGEEEAAGRGACRRGRSRECHLDFQHQS